MRHLLARKTVLFIGFLLGGDMRLVRHHCRADAVDGLRLPPVLLVSRLEHAIIENLAVNIDDGQGEHLVVLLVRAGGLRINEHDLLARREPACKHARLEGLHLVDGVHHLHPHRPYRVLVNVGAMVVILEDLNGLADADVVHHSLGDGDPYIPGVVDLLEDGVGEARKTVSAVLTGVSLDAVSLAVLLVVDASELGAGDSDIVVRVNVELDIAGNRGGDQVADLRVVHLVGFSHEVHHSEKKRDASAI